METKVQYCLNTLMRKPGHSCDACGLFGTAECKEICKDVEEMI